MTDPDRKEQATREGVDESRDSAISDRPRVADVALWLWYAAITLYAIMALTGYAGSEEMRLRPGMAVAEILKQLILCALMLIPVRALARGRNWGRVLLTCVVALFLIVPAVAFISNFLAEPLAAALMTVLLLSALGAVVASFHPHTNRWIASRRRQSG